MKQKRLLCDAFMTCWVCKASKSTSPLVFSKGLLFTLKLCKLYKLMRARKPICQNCYELLRECMYKVLVIKVVSLYRHRRYKARSSCVACGSFSKRIRGFPKASVQKYAIERMMKYKKELRGKEYVCKYCYNLVCTMVQFFYADMDEDDEEDEEYEADEIF